MAAIHVALLAAGVRAGTGVVAALDLYGATTTLLERLLTELGVKVKFVDVADLAAVEAALKETRPAAFLAEIISNPLLKVADVPALADLAHRYGVHCLIDNTFATPYLFTPLACGADYVIHSATKYIGGHGDVMAGVVVTSAENRRKLYEANKLVGSVLGPFEAWLALRGVKTLPLRMRQQCASAQAVAEWLATRPASPASTIPDSPRIRSMRSRGGSSASAVSAAWCRSRSPAPIRPRCSASWRPSSCVCRRRRWGTCTRSSSTRRRPPTAA